MINQTWPQIRDLRVSIGPMLKTGDVGTFGSWLHYHSTFLLPRAPTADWKRALAIAKEKQLNSLSETSRLSPGLHQFHPPQTLSVSLSIKPHLLFFTIWPDPTRFSSKSHRFRSLRRPDGERGRFRLLHGPAHMARLPRADAPPLRRRVRQIHQEVLPLSFLNSRFLSSRFLSIRIQHFSILLFDRWSRPFISWSCCRDCPIISLVIEVEIFVDLKAVIVCSRLATWWTVWTRRIFCSIRCGRDFWK